MSQTQDKEFVQSFSLVVGLLLVVTLLVGGVASIMSGGVGKNMDRFKKTQAELMLERISPVVTIEMLTTDAPAMPVAAASAKPPKELFTAVCAACHTTGVAGAPLLGKKDQWESRFNNEGGLDGLVAVAIKGKGAMPPKGGSSYSDEEIHSIVQYMLSEAGLVEAPAAAAEPAAAAPAAAAEPMAAADSAPASSAPATTETFVAENNNLDLAAGEKSYRAACFACHDTGAAGAPKLGDKALWAPRIATGMAALTQAAIKGKGAMPPKGGATYLSDDEVANVVAFMVSKAQ